MGRTKMYFQRVSVMSADKCQHKNWKDVRGDGPRHSLLVCLLHSSVQSVGVCVFLEVIMEEVLHVRGERSKRNRRKLLVK